MDKLDMLELLREHSGMGYVEIQNILGCAERRQLRDEFAMAALGGLLANHEVITSIGKNPRNAKINWGDAVAYEAYILADAMLAAREKSAS